jgi:FkbM family methyltransferase
MATMSLGKTSAEREVEIRIDDEVFRIISDDNYIDMPDNRFEPHMVRLFKSLIQRDDLVLDIGANIGCTALLFARNAREVHAFEPSVPTFGYLTRNIRTSGAKNVVLHNHALGSSATVTELTYPPTFRAGAFISDKLSAGPDHVIERIRVETVDSLGFSPDFMKIDTEGFELHVVRGAKATLAKAQPTVVMEMNHWCLNAMQRIFIPDFLDVLRSTFPILLAVHGRSYRNLHNPAEAYHVMHEHIVHFKYGNLIGAFSESRLRKFQEVFTG